ncbi:MAG: SH3 domain-containing protein [Blautia sp.]|nr:SH3 domain-containing protein [Blautia sp.]
MKKKSLVFLLLGVILCLPGCGFNEGADAIVTVIEATPTPIPTPSPTPLPATPTPEPTPTPSVVMEQSPSGVNIEVKEGNYTAASDLNLRADCNADAEFIIGIPSGTTLHSTGVCENGWVRVEYDGKTGFVTGDYVTPVQ